MRILIIRATKAIGGAEIYNLNLIKAFQKYYPKDKLIFITALSKFSKRIKKEGAEVITLSVFSEEVGTKKSLLRLVKSFPRYFLTYLRTIFVLTRREKIDLICIQSATEKIFLTPIFKILKIKTIWLEHGPYFSFPTAKEILFLYKRISHFSDKVVTVSQNTFQDALKGGMSRNKLICVCTGIDLDHFNFLSEKTSVEIKKKINIEIRKMIVGYLGDFSEGKGIFGFLEVAKEIIGKVKDINFVLVGSGKLLPDVKKAIRENTLTKKFLFPGFKEDIRSYLGIFDVLLYPNKLGSIPMVLLEAMAMGVPVVARDIGGNQELVLQGKTGYLFKDETPEELAEIIINLLKNRKKRETMRKAARERVVKYFNEKRWITELHKVFEEVIKR